MKVLCWIVIIADDEIGRGAASLGAKDLGPNRPLHEEICSALEINQRTDTIV